MFSSCRDRLNFKIWTKTLQKIIHRIIPELYEVACICLPASAHFLMYYHFLLVHYQCHGDHIQTTFILTDFINVTDKKKNLLKRILINIIFWRSLQEVLAYSTLACYYAKIDHTEHAVDKFLSWPCLRYYDWIKHLLHYEHTNNPSQQCWHYKIATVSLLLVYYQILGIQISFL